MQFWTEVNLLHFEVRRSGSQQNFPLVAYELMVHRRQASGLNMPVV